MKTVFARYGDTFNTGESGADHDINDVFELVAIVDRLNDGSGDHPVRRAHETRIREDA